MPGKKKSSKAKEATKAKKEEAPEEEVIEIKTSKKEEVKAEDEVPKVDTKKAEVSSFSQLDADDKEQPSEDKAKGPEGVQPSSVEDPTEGVEKVSVDEKPPEKKPETSEEASPDEAKNWLSGVEQEIEAEGKSGFNFKKLLLILLVFAVLGLIAGGFFYYRSRVASQPVEEEPSLVPTKATSTPIPTPEEAIEEEEVDLSEYLVSVLNGSGIPGEAGAVEDLLTEAGFESIETGNADSYDYKQTEVSLKEEVPSGVFKSIEDALGDTYNVVLSETSLSEDSTSDVIVNVGTRK
ncbi:LytR C-terminal domain-containing protein [Patescibacteria group bacterium]|nr:LytR C-terminal domain-containing protein [Patescibacteria group bacterium]